ncbi:ABC transporter ATP-binding protein [Lacticaseibacillus songhuajiangensis]|jgi:sulfonate transport system ATP-binding protein|uniref:ABC transporter ATP-binding protein n=1 Tax=Lacticaseibacillus songhuajiangensis TaxID=1296539 RepID=UPI000F7ADE84|nr:ABC transporter ATP-binding protein [Lacticaseibacillus songhuajiangensis]
MTASALLDVKDVNKYYGDAHVLRDIDLQIQRGEFVALVGQSGGGKSTLLRLIAGLEDTTTGELRQDGHAISGLNPDSRVMFQNDRLLPWLTVKENLAFADKSKSADADADQLLQRVELTEFANAYPAALSGGQRQRVALARALMAKPELLLLDEPLGALDALTRRKMQDLILQLWTERKMTVVLVTHDVNEAVRMASRIFVVAEHEIVQTYENPTECPRSDEDIAPLAQKVLDTIVNN